MMKKMMLLATMAAAIAAFVAPAAAHADEAGLWAMGGSELHEEGTLTLHGKLKLTASGGTIECTVHSHIDLTPTTGTGLARTFTATNCVTGGILGGCTVTSVTEENLPWTIHARKNPASIRITGIKFINHLSGFLCPSTISGEGELSAFPDSSTAMTKVTFNEESGKLATNGFGEASVSGTLSAETNSGTYGVI